MKTIYSRPVAFLLVFLLIFMPMVLPKTDWYSALPAVLTLIFLFKKSYWLFLFDSIKSNIVVFLAVVYFLLSSAWSYSSHQVLTSFLNIVFIPFVCFFCSAWLVNQSRIDQLNIGKLFLSLLFSMAIVTLIALAAGGKDSLWHVFYDLGYYSTYSIVLAAGCIPFLNKKSRVIFYPTIAILFFLTDQRVVWLVFPLLVVVDVFNANKKLSWKHYLGLGFALIGSYAVLKYLQSIRPADAFAVVKNQQSLSLLDYLLKNERLILWQDWIHRGMSHPIVGVGFGKENTLAYFSSRETWDVSKLYHAHNIFINAFVQTGLLGLALLSAGYGYTFLKLKKYFSSPVGFSIAFILLFYLFRNQFDCFDAKRIMMVYFGLLGAGYGFIKKYHDSNHSILN